MNAFQNVTVIKNANIYYDGAVTSREVRFADGDMKTLGIMMPGDYHFGTEKKEIMEILAGSVDIRLPGETEWREINAGDTFEVPANSGFDIKVKTVTDYCCSYIG